MARSHLYGLIPTNSPMRKQAFLITPSQLAAVIFGLDGPPEADSAVDGVYLTLHDVREALLGTT